ncbi:hypothetical protein NKI94_20435 [Mesorhizobium australicum]|uniref:hypothetical protein n=1 Tax=Mesorhizobium australicum TaxID=536018 RepID=UPI00333689CD
MDARPPREADADRNHGNADPGFGKGRRPQSQPALIAVRWNEQQDGAGQPEDAIAGLRHDGGALLDGISPECSDDPGYHPEQPERCDGLSNLHAEPPPELAPNIYRWRGGNGTRPLQGDGISGNNVVIGIKRSDRIISAFDWTALSEVSRPAACRKQT